MPIKINNAQTRVHMLRKSFNPVEKVPVLKLRNGIIVEWPEQLVRKARYNDRLVIQALSEECTGTEMYHYRKGDNIVTAIYSLIKPRSNEFFGNLYELTKKIPGLEKMADRTPEDIRTYISENWSNSKLLNRRW